jgi:predicted RNase H-like nuclease (RuvC/YqgF family)
MPVGSVLEGIATMSDLTPQQQELARHFPSPDELRAAIERAEQRSREVGAEIAEAEAALTAVLPELETAQREVEAANQKLAEVMGKRDRLEQLARRCQDLEQVPELAQIGVEVAETRLERSQLPDILGVARECPDAPLRPETLALERQRAGISVGQRMLYVLRPRRWGIAHVTVQERADTVEEGREVFVHLERPQKTTTNGRPLQGPNVLSSVTARPIF